MTRTRHTLLVVLTVVASFAAGMIAQRAEDRADARLRPRFEQLRGPQLDGLVVQQVTPPDALPAYDTLEEAAAHGAERLYQCSHAYECGGSIAQRPDGKFVLGPVRTDYAGDSVHINHHVPATWKLVADYHSHPCNPASHAVAYFSPEDMSENTALRITGIMLDECTGNIHEFIPGRDVPNNQEVVEGVYLTQGRIVGHIQVDGISQEPNTGL